MIKFDLVQDFQEVLVKEQGLNYETRQTSLKSFKKFILENFRLYISACSNESDSHFVVADTRNVRVAILI